MGVAPPGQHRALIVCEAEIVALSEAAKDAVYFRRFFKGVMHAFADRRADRPRHGQQGGSQLFYNSSYNPTNHDRMKHVAHRHYFVRDMVEAFEINVPYVSTHENISDFFTKPLADPKFHEFRSVLMNEAGRPSE